MRVRELFISFFDTWFARAIVFTIDTTSAPPVGQFSVGVNILRDLKVGILSPYQLHRPRRVEGRP